MRAAQQVMADLAASGLTAEQLALVMELSATVATEARPVVDASAERRRARDREYQAAKRSRRPNRQKSADMGDATPPNEVSSNPDEVLESGEASPHSARAPAQPVAAGRDVWNEVAAVVGWPTVSSLNSTRTRNLSARLREHGLEGWKAALSRAQSSPYLGHDPPSWFTFDWITRAGNFLKLIEGNYDRRIDTNLGSGRRMGGPEPDPTLALVRAATEAQRQDGGDYWQARAALPAR